MIFSGFSGSRVTAADIARETAALDMAQEKSAHFAGVHVTARVPGPPMPLCCGGWRQAERCCTAHATQSDRLSGQCADAALTDQTRPHCRDPLQPPSPLRHSGCRELPGRAPPAGTDGYLFSSASSSTSTQCRTGVAVPLCKCVMQPILAETITSGCIWSRLASLRSRSW